MDKAASLILAQSWPWGSQIAVKKITEFHWVAEIFSLYHGDLLNAINQENNCAASKDVFCHSGFATFFLFDIKVVFCVTTFCYEGHYSWKMHKQKFILINLNTGGFAFFQIFLDCLFWVKIIYRIDFIVHSPSNHYFYVKHRSNQIWS